MNHGPLHVFNLGELVFKVGLSLLLFGGWRGGGVVCFSNLVQERGVERFRIVILIHG